MAISDGDTIFAAHHWGSGTSFPTNPAPVNGQWFFRSDEGLMYRYYNSTWNVVSGDNARLTIAQTLTNKRITRREVTITSSATPTPNSDTTDIYTITALAAAATFGAPTGTPTQGQTLLYRIKDNGTAQALNWNAIHRAGTDVALPTTTVLGKTLYAGFIYNSTDSKWDLLFVDNGF
ncbi:MAG: hypothetical protein ACYC0T_21815 [Ramlibacter sp.]